MALAIEIIELIKYYGSGELRVKALSNINLRLETAEFAVLAGPSGSGKTTLLNIIGTLDKPTHGQVIIEGVSITGSDERENADFRRKRLGFIFQAYNLIPVLTVYENVEFPLKLLKAFTKKERKERVEALLTEVGIEKFSHRRPGELSGGQQQRVAIARALIKEPAIVLADEPTANLDSMNGGKIMALMREMNIKKGISFLFSSHDKLVIDNAQRVIMLRDGQIIKESRTK